MILVVSLEPAISKDNGENIIRMPFNHFLLLEFPEAHVFSYYQGHQFLVN